MATLDKTKETEIIVAITQARYKQQQAFDTEDDAYVKDHAYAKDVVVEVEAMHIKHEGIDAALESARQTREGLGQAVSQVSNLIVRVIDSEHAESTDRTFSYNGGDGRLMMILSNKMKWNLVNGEWLITYVSFDPIIVTIDQIVDLLTYCTSLPNDIQESSLPLTYYYYYLNIHIMWTLFSFSQRRCSRDPRGVVCSFDLRSRAIAKPSRLSIVRFNQISRSANSEGSSSLRGFYDDTIEKWANKPSRPLSLRALHEFGGKITPQRLLLSASFVHNELPVRLAKELRNLEILPFIVMINPHIKKVYELYYRAFKKLIEFPHVKTPQDNAEFVKLLQELVSDTVNIIELLGKGVMEAYRRVPPEMINIQTFLDQFLTARIGRRVLAEQHIQLSNVMDPEGTVKSIIDPQLSPVKCLEVVKPIVTDMCQLTYGIAPDFEILGQTKATVPFLPHHLQYIFLEVLKNACRATVEYHRAKTGRHFPDLPPVQILLVESHNYVTIKISDRGGGIPQAIVDKIFNYGYTTVKDVIERRPTTGLGILGTNAEELHQPLAGLGFGLPLSRLYSRYFGGTFDLFSVEGYGTDVYLKLSRSGEIAETLQF